MHEKPTTAQSAVADALASGVTATDLITELLRHNGVGGSQVAGLLGWMDAVAYLDRYATSGLASAERADRWTDGVRREMHDHDQIRRAARILQTELMRRAGVAQ